MNDRVPQTLHHHLIGMHKIRYGPASILFFTLALIVSCSNDSDLHYSELFKSIMCTSTTPVLQQALLVIGVPKNTNTCILHSEL